MKRMGPYELVRVIGRGGFGVVHEARHVEHGGRVALKALNRLPSPHHLARFQVEAEVAARLRHPGIVAVHDYGHSDGKPFLAMEFVEGESLDVRLARQGPYPPREAVALLRALAEAVEHAHQRSVLHRDLKPANIIISTDGRALITDFGLARDMAAERERLTQTGTLLGTPAYMPPEQAGGEVKEMGFGGDVYALGAILFALLTSHPPFERDTNVAVLASILHKEPDALTDYVPDLDPALEAIVLHCLEKHPGDRYASAKALADDLQRWLDGEAVTAEQTSGVQRARRWARRQRALVIGAVCASAALLLLISFAVGPPWRAPPPPDTLPYVELDSYEVLTEDKTVRIAGTASDPEPMVLTVESEGGRVQRKLPQGRFAVEVPVPVGRSEVRVHVRDGAGSTVEALVSVRRLPVWFADAARRPAALPREVEATAVPGQYRNASDGSLLVWIPPGTFTMGSRSAMWSKSEVPSHEVTLTRGFFLGVHELDWGTYERFCEETRRERPSRRIGGRRAADDEPVFNVTWQDARDYCAWAGLRLPTEAEWEYASRAGREQAIRPWADDFTAEGRCNMQSGDAYPHTSPAGAFADFATAWGCQDMAGNVNEWVQDFSAPYTEEPRTDPVVKEGTMRMSRGGAWDRPEWTQRCAWRGSKHPDRRYPNTGFRVARDGQ